MLENRDWKLARSTAILLMTGDSISSAMDPVNRLPESVPEDPAIAPMRT